MFPKNLFKTDKTIFVPVSFKSWISRPVFFPQQDVVIKENTHVSLVHMEADQFFLKMITFLIATVSLNLIITSNEELVGSTEWSANQIDSRYFGWKSGYCSTCHGLRSFIVS